MSNFLRKKGIYGSIKSKVLRSGGFDDYIDD